MDAKTLREIETFRTWVANVQPEKMVFFGGAGVSTESGIPDFRSADGLYAQKFPHPPEQMISRSFFDAHPDEFFGFYCERMLALGAQPNQAHRKVAELEHSGILSSVITQNIDGLHQKAGSKTVYELHGSVLRNYCMDCGAPYSVEELLALREKSTPARTGFETETESTNATAEADSNIADEDVARKSAAETSVASESTNKKDSRKANQHAHTTEKIFGVPYCPVCGGIVKPDVVLYEESLDEKILTDAIEAIMRADLMVVAGTSLAVYPAAGLLNYFSGEHLVIINRTPTPHDRQADLCIAANVGEVFNF